MIKKYFSDYIKYFKNFGIVLEYFQLGQWNTALWEKRRCYWCTKFALPKGEEIYPRIWQILEKRKITFSVCLNLYNVQKVLRAAKTADAIALQLIPTFEERTFLSLQKQGHGPIIWSKPSRTLSDIYSRFYSSTLPS